MGRLGALADLNRIHQTKRLLLFGLGLLSLVSYLIAWQLGDLREHTLGFELAFFAAFGLYATVTVLSLRLETFSKWEWVAVFGFAILFQGFLIFTPPTLSDDMYRYVWDGRVQAQGIVAVVALAT